MSEIERIKLTAQVKAKDKIIQDQASMLVTRIKKQERAQKHCRELAEVTAQRDAALEALKPLVSLAGFVKLDPKELTASDTDACERAFISGDVIRAAVKVYTDNSPALRVHQARLEVIEALKAWIAKEPESVQYPTPSDCEELGRMQKALAALAREEGQ